MVCVEDDRSHARLGGACPSLTLYLTVPWAGALLPHSLFICARCFLQAQIKGNLFLESCPRRKLASDNLPAKGSSRRWRARPKGNVILFALWCKRYGTVSSAASVGGASRCIFLESSRVSPELLLSLLTFCSSL